MSYDVLDLEDAGWLDDELDGYDAMSSRALARPVSTDRYEASLFMNAARLAAVTRVFSALLVKGVRRGRFQARRLASDSLYRNQVSNLLLMQAVRSVYRQVHGHASPSHALTRQLVAAYRSRTNTARTVLGLLARLGGAVFEDETDALYI
ncbi:hypothetical protein [Maricaulis sp.]|uniref:hypothetical protein n=1 Tax=Maricaulis sp. TaxID=1486257 RepID=UPI0026312225|nr:hypothetical protein [Maricaulis sp.]